MRKPAFCICENKDADQLRGNREADQRLCFRYTDSTIPLLPKSEISSLSPSSVTVQPGLCWTWSEISKTGFLTTRLMCLLFLDYHHAERYDEMVQMNMIYGVLVGFGLASMFLILLCVVCCYVKNSPNRGRKSHSMNISTPKGM